MKILFVIFVALLSVNAFANEKYICDAIYKENKVSLEITVTERTDGRNDAVDIIFKDNKTKKVFTGATIKNRETFFSFMVTNKDESIIMMGDFKRDSLGLKFLFIYPVTGENDEEVYAEGCRVLPL